jgi:hypothetical protein
MLKLVENAFFVFIKKCRTSWIDGQMDVKAVLRMACSNKKIDLFGQMKDTVFI